MPWEAEFEEYGRVFFMTPLSPEHMLWWEYDGPDEELLAQTVEQTGEKRLQIRSGLYYNTDPLVNIYYVDEYFHHLFFSSCGIYFVHVGPSSPWGSRAHPDGYAVRFFRHGTNETSYRIEDLTSHVWHSTTAGVLWIEQDTLSFNQQANTLSLRTIENRAFTFDITTGEIISGPRNIPSIPIIIAIAALLAVIILIIYKRKSKRKDDRL